MNLDYPYKDTEPRTGVFTYIITISLIVGILVIACVSGTKDKLNPTAIETEKSICLKEYGEYALKDLPSKCIKYFTNPKNY